MDTLHQELPANLWVTTDNNSNFVGGGGGNIFKFTPTKKLNCVANEHKLG